MTSDPRAATSGGGDAQRPKVSIAVSNERLRARLLDSLARADVEVRSLPRGSDVWAALRDEDADIVIVRRSQIADAGLDRIAEQPDDAPGVVVISDDDDPLDRTRLLAAGASQVLDIDETSAHLTRVLETVAEVEADGGRDGPEAGGRPAAPKLADFLSRSPDMRRFLDMVRRVKDAKSSLLITGETGVGKERLARAIHAESPRAAGPFVAVNCGALPEQLLESELFGHEKGAFTGAAARRQGAFEAASGGTIFLDEIAEMPVHLQVKLLTVLQRHEVQRLGGTAPVGIDLRVMAATNRDVTQDIADGRLRQDLYYRLNVIGLEIPPLRERREDLPDLIGYLIASFRETMPDSEVQGITAPALDAMLAHAWPGNMRELVNVVERAMLLCRGNQIDLPELPPEITGAAPGAAGAGESDAQGLPTDWAGLTLKEVRDAAVVRAERAYLDAVLREVGGRVGEAAARAGIGSRALYDRMKRLGLKKEDFK